jgi:UDP-perosamine 4-acetyltransferase
MGNKLVLIGGGGHCKSVLDATKGMATFDEIVITDPDIDTETMILGCKVVGTDDELPRLRSEGFDYAFITVGSIESTALRRKLVEKAEMLGFKFATIIDPSATVSEYAHIGSGSFIGKNTVINADAVVGSHCIINTGSIVEHECKVGDFTHISVGSILCGNTEIGEDSLIGAGSTVIQGIKVGSCSIIGAGSVVVKDIQSNVKAHGNPCKVIE